MCHRAHVHTVFFSFFFFSFPFLTNGTTLGNGGGTFTPEDAEVPYCFRVLKRESQLELWHWPRLDFRAAPTTAPMRCRVLRVSPLSLFLPLPAMDLEEPFLPTPRCNCPLRCTVTICNASSPRCRRVKNWWCRYSSGGHVLFCKDRNLDLTFPRRTMGKSFHPFFSFFFFFLQRKSEWKMRMLELTWQDDCYCWTIILGSFSVWK